jgi:hypothetical protein
MSTKYWLGKAANVTQVDTITVANTWAENDTVTLTVNGNDLLCTVGSLVTTADVAALISAAINAFAPSSSATAGDYNVGGQQIPEFTEFTASVSGSVVTVTGTTAGKPFTLSVTESTAGSGTATLASVTAATGQKFWSSGDNWSGGTVPANADGVVYENGNVDCAYGLPTALELASLTVDMSYTGRIGLPPVNTDGTPYAEYRTRYPVFKDISAAASVYRIGQGTGSGPKLVNIKHDSASGGTYTNGWADITVHNTGQSGVDGQRVVNISTGSDTSDHVLKVLQGSVAVGVDGESARILTADIGTSSQGNQADVYFGSGATLVNVGLYNGAARWGGATTTARVEGGTARIEGSGTQAALTVRGGQVDYVGTGTVTALNAVGGLVDFSKGAGALTVTAIEAYKTGGVYDPTGRINTGTTVDLNQCRVSELSRFDLGANRRLTLGAVA